MNIKNLSLLLLLFINHWSLNLYAQPDNTALGDIQVASPEVASLAKFTEASNNHFTGAAGISIPIEVLEEGNIKLPISVNYHASGIRVGEVASRVGMGWALSAKGVISRTILGIEDEAANGYLKKNYNYDLGSVLNNVSKGDADGEPDLWSYSLPGGISGKFIINKSIDKIVQYPRSDVKIEISGNDLEEFTIITTDGTRYLFGQKGNENYDGFIQVGELPHALNGKEETTKSHHQTANQNGRNQTGPKRQHTEWYLRKIESYDKNYSINFTYKAKEYILISPASEQTSEIYSNRNTNDEFFFQGDAGFGVGSESVGAFSVLPGGNVRTQLPLYGSIQHFESKELASISTSTTRVDFIEGSSKRQDLDAVPYSDSEIANNIARPAYLCYPLGQIKISGIGGNVYCKTFRFNYDYFKAFAQPLYSFDVRLKLNSIEEVSCKDGARVPPYVFDYYTKSGINYDFLPWRLNKARDAYGFYNGAESNNNKKFTFPLTTLSVSLRNQVLSLTRGEANRKTVFTPMQYGTLKSVTFPEGGKNEYIYEANSIKRVRYDTTEVNAPRILPPFSNCRLNSQSSTLCCGTKDTSKVYTFTSDFIDSGLIKIYLQKVGCMSEPGVPYQGIVRLRLRDEVTGNTIGKLQEANSMSFLDSLTIDIKDAYPNMVANRGYRFEMEVTECRAYLFFKKKKIIPLTDNELVGGLRIKEQRSLDRQGNILNATFYDYSRPTEPGISSGVVYKKPYFGQVISGDDITAENGGVSINNIFIKFTWNSNPILPLTDLQGYHIGYQNVRSYQSNGAFTKYVYQTQSLDAALGNSTLPYPIGPLRYFYDNGRLKRSQQGGKKAGADYVVAHQGYSVTTLPQTIDQNDAVRVEVQSGEAGTLFLRNKFQWQHSGFYQPARDTQIIDGVRTITTYGYTSFPRKHLQPNSVTMVNSDGEETVNKTRFAHEIIADKDLPNQTIYQEMIDRNMIAIPIEQTREVNNTLVSGVRTQFGLFHNDPYLAQVYQYETTWDSSGTEQKTGWELLGVVNEYYAYGKAKKITRKHWSPMTYDYHPVHRLPTKKQYLNFEWQYAYHAGSRLPSKITNIDGQYIDYQWDGLGRLDSIIARKGKVITNFDYAYTGQDNTRPQTYVKQQTTYGTAPRSELKEQTLWEYFDDIGRSHQKVKQAYSNQNKQDVVSAIAYDLYNRPHKEYEYFESPHSNGQMVTVPSTTPFTLTTYEETPLNRPQQKRPPSWYSTRFEYGANTVTDTVLNLRTGVAYAPNLLSKEVVIDSNEHKQIIFKDKRGRGVLSRMEGKTSADRADTYTLYDVKERPNVIVPPGATLMTTPQLIFKTYYDGADNPILKKIPDMAIMEMIYNDRDLMIAQQGGNLRKDGKWMVSEYDDYGRVTKTGINVTPTVVDEVWTENYYDGNTSAAILSELGITEADLPTNLNSNISIGKLTAEARFVLNGNTLTGDKIFRVLRYNDYGQMSRDWGNNHYKGSRLWKNMEYDFADNLTHQRRRFHTKAITIDQRDTLTITYDHQGRPIDTYHSMNNKPRQHLSRLTYTAKDEVQTKQLGGTNNGFLQTINYEYLDNGFLKGINPTLASDDLFKLDINYDQTITGLSGLGQKNGNITSLTWQVKGQPSQTYGYHYDYLDRLTAANYNLNNNAYGTSYSYDLRGNFTNISRRGVYSDGTNYVAQQIDSMAFTPHAGTNKIKTITDSAPCPNNKVIHRELDNTELHAVGQTIQADNTVMENAAITYQAGKSITLQAGFHAKAGTDFVAKIETCPQGGFETDGFVQRSHADIEYDVDGNRTKDPNKGIEIAFNYLNQPYKVTWQNGNTIEWLRDGGGTKLQRLTKRNGVAIGKLDYVDGSIEYENDTLTTIYFEDAKATFDKGVLEKYAWFIKDYLMSTRVVFEEGSNGQVVLLSEHHSYPFGMELKGDFGRDRSVKRLYNFKERIGDFGLNWSDFGARYYLGNGGEPVFLGVDPISEQFAHVSTYNYAENSPIANIDLWGLQKYFTANGEFILQQGDDESIRIVNSGSISECQNMTCGELQSNSVLAYRDNESNVESVLGDWALEHKAKTGSTEVEYAMSLFSKEITDDNGETIQVFIPGTTAKGRKLRGGGAVNILDSKSEIAGSEITGWDRSSTIHTHPSGSALNFSGLESLDGFISTDTKVAIRKNINLYLTTPRDNRVGLFDPAKYNDKVVRAGDGYIYNTDHKKAAKAAVSIGFHLKK